MKSLLFILLTVYLISLTSCASQEPQNIEPVVKNTSQTDEQTNSPNPSDTGMDGQPAPDNSPKVSSNPHVSSKPELEPLSFPVSDEARKLSASQALAFDELGKAITSYRRAEGSNPRTIKDFVNTGYPLFWPRNVSSGKPAIIFLGKELDLQFSSFGSVHYTKNDEGFALMKYLYFKWGRALDGTDDTWELYTAAFPAKEVNNLSLVEGCDTPIHLVDDKFSRKVLASVGQITGLIITETIRNYDFTDTLLSSFYDLLSPQQMVIRENYEKFVELMKSPDVEFKWGNDLDKQSTYLYLKIKGKVYMEQCYYLGGGTSLDALQNMKTCSFSELDTSSPILSSENIDQFVIPDEYLISIKDIPETDPSK